MLSPLLLRVDVDLDGGWRLALGAPETQPATGRLDPVVVAEIQAAAAAALAPGPSAVQGKVHRQEQAESAAGRALAQVFLPTAILSRLVAHRTQATSQGDPFVLAVDCARPELAALPWELIAEAPDGPPLEESAGSVVRLAMGPTPREAAPASRLRLLIACPTPDDLACAEVLSALGGQTRPEVEVQALSEGLDGALPETPPGAADLLLVLCHGETVEGGTLLDWGDRGEGGPGGLVAGWAQGLRGLAGVVLGVCAGGAPSVHQLADLAGRLLRAGAPAVFCASAPVGTDALIAFAHGLLDALGQEAPPAAAARGARHAVGRLRIPHPDSRPCTFRLQVPDLGALARPWILRQWRPDGWPTPDPALAALLARAHALARGRGWIGIEHLIDAWPEDARGLADALRRTLSGWNPAFAQHLRAGHDPRPDAVAPLLCTPRLRRLAAALPGELAGLDDLAAALIDDPTHALHLLAIRPLGNLRWDPMGSQLSLASQGERPLPDLGAPATRFEVLWGPEDGRRIQPEPNQTLGRWHQRPVDDHLLFEDTPVVDRHLHRQHLRYLGPGEVALLHRGRVVSSEETRQEGVDGTGHRRVGAGDIIKLSPGTWLRALGPG